METTHIQAFHARYRLPARATAQRRRLDRVLAATLEETLESAIQRAGVPTGEEICIRQLFVPLRARLSLGDADLAEAWSRALAEAIRGAARGGSSEAVAVVRYRSRVEALIDCAASAVQGDLSRAWAWRQLGFWPAGEPTSRAEAAREVVRALVREAGLILPVLSVGAQRGWLIPLARCMNEQHWLALAGAALAAAGSPVTWRELADPPPRSLSTLAALPLARRLMARSKLAPAFATLNSSREPPRVFAALVLLEVEPALAAQPSRTVLSLVAAVHHLLTTRPGERLASATDAAADKSRVEAGPAASNPPAHRSAQEEPAAPPADLRARATTEQGGLLFLLNLLEPLGVPARIADLFPDRLPRWVFHQLALALAPVAADDPAALAFAGLAPDGEPPNAEQAAPSSAECEQLSSIVAGIVAELSRRLVSLDLPADGVLPFVCARRAGIVADPGWIEAGFSMEDVSTDLRRAGLDLNPGYLPWLGVVVRFAYE